MSPLLRVLVVLPAAVLGGAEAWLLDLLDATDRLDVQVVALAEGAAAQAFRDRGSPVTVLPTGRRAVDGLRPALALGRLLGAAPPDVVLANGVKAAVLAVPVCTALGVPVVWAKHDRSFDGRLARPLARLATRVVTTDPSTGAATGRDDLVVVVPPAPPPALPRSQARARLGLPADALVALLVGRLVDYKGGDDAVRAVACAPGWTLAVVGQDDPAAPGERARLAALAASCGVADRVVFTGHVPGARRLAGAGDVLLVLTRPNAGADGDRSPGVEGFGTTALEAARAGVPVIAVAGSPPAARLGESAGAVVPPADPRALGAALVRLADPVVRSAAGRAAAALSADHPDAPTCAGLLVDVLAAAALRPGAGRVGPPVSVVTTVLDEGAETAVLLERLRGQLRPDDQAVVVDGGSRDGTWERLQAAAAADPRLTVLREDGAGISRGRNLGIGAARHEVVLCTDAGCAPVPGWRDALGGAFCGDVPLLVTGTYRASARPGVRWEQALAAVGYPDPAEARRTTPLVRAYGRVLGRTYDPSCPTGRSVAFTRSAWRAAGGFPEHLQTGEDVTFGRAAVRAGVPAALAVDAEVAWAQRPTLRANLRMYRAYGRGDGLSGDRRLIGRNLARGTAYPLGAALVGAGGPGLVLAGLGAAAYLSLPLRRAGASAPACLPLVPVMALLRDAAKALGCLEGVRQRRRS